jgi:curli biogenesis system outer membrane secretion channel CsgG
VRRALAAALLLPLLAGCATTATVRGGGGPGIDEVRLEPYDGPKARISVGSFEDKTAKGEREIGGGMATMLTTALVNSNRFLVLERDLLDEVIREQDLGASGRVQPATAAPRGEIEGAELIVLGAVTAFEPEAMGVGGALLGIGTLVGSAILHEKHSAVPVAAATYTESYVAVDLRVVDTATSRVLASVSVEGRGYDMGGGFITEIGGGRARLPLAFGGFQKGATEEAIRKAIDLGAAEIARRTPPEYYRHRDDEFSAGRMLGFAYLDLPGLTGERFPQSGVRVAESDAAWAALAGELGLAGAAAAPPVDFSAQRVAAIVAGGQAEAGRTVSVEKVVGYPDRVEITVSLLPPAPGATIDKVTPAVLHPMALVRLDRAGPITVTWQSR